MDANSFQIAIPGVLSDPQWIALESLGENTEHFVFADGMLESLQDRGLVEAGEDRWRVTRHGLRALSERQV